MSLTLNDRVNYLLCLTNLKANGIELLGAACCNDMKTVISRNLFNYQDRNGYTALHKSVASTSLDVIREIARSRPVLKGIPDNVSKPICNNQ